MRNSGRHAWDWILDGGKSALIEASRKHLDAAWEAVEAAEGEGAYLEKVRSRLRLAEEGFKHTDMWYRIRRLNEAGRTGEAVAHARRIIDYIISTRGSDGEPGGLYKMRINRSDRTWEGDLSFGNNGFAPNNEGRLMAIEPWGEVVYGAHWSQGYPPLSTIQSWDKTSGEIIREFDLNEIYGNRGPGQLGVNAHGIWLTSNSWSYPEGRKFGPGMLVYIPFELSSGRPLTSGVYFLRMTAGGVSANRSVSLLK